MQVGILLSRNIQIRYRFPQFVQPFKEEGIYTDIYRLSSSFPGFFQILKQLRKKDIVVILRKLLPPLQLKLIRRYSKRLIFDYDDAIMYRSSRWADQYSRTRTARFKNMVRACDLVIAGNRFLKEEAVKYISAEGVQVIPTVVDIEKYTPKQYDFSKDRVTLGWIGSQGTLHYLKMLIPIFEAIGSNFPSVQLNIVCNDFFDVPKMKVIKKEWSEADEIDDLQEFDIGLGPLTDDVWTRGKCGFKLIQYQAVGVPVVCSPVGANKEIVVNGETGFWASEPREWIEKLSILIENPELRSKMGKKGRVRIEKEYSLQATAPRLSNIIKSMFS